MISHYTTLVSRSQTLAGRVWLRETNTTLPWGDDDEADNDSMA